MFGGFPNVNIPVIHIELCNFLKSDNNVVDELLVVLQALLCSVHNILFLNNRVQFKMDNIFFPPMNSTLNDPPINVKMTSCFGTFHF